MILCRKINLAWLHLLDTTSVIKDVKKITIISNEECASPDNACNCFPINCDRPDFCEASAIAYPLPIRRI